jgi:hypothetical protein
MIGNTQFVQIYFPGDHRLHFLDYEGWHEKSTKQGVRARIASYPRMLITGYMTLDKLPPLSES